MLTITVDPNNPLQALEDCTALVRMLAEVFTLPRDAELSERAQSAAALIFNAIEDGQDAINASLSEALRDDEGRMKPGWRRRLESHAELAAPGISYPIYFQDTADYEAALAAGVNARLMLSSAGMSHPASACQPQAAPSLTEPRPTTAARSRRAA